MTRSSSRCSKKWQFVKNEKNKEGGGEGKNSRFICDNIAALACERLSKENGASVQTFLRDSLRGRHRTASRCNSCTREMQGFPYRSSALCAAPTSKYRYSRVARSPHVDRAFSSSSKLVASRIFSWTDANHVFRSSEEGSARSSRAIRAERVRRSKGKAR